MILISYMYHNNVYLMKNIFQDFQYSCSYLNTWFVQTMTECWLESWLSRTCNTKCIQIKSPVLFCNLVKTIHDLSCSDCVTINWTLDLFFSFSFFSILIYVCAYPVGLDWCLLRYLTYFLSIQLVSFKAFND